MSNFFFQTCPKSSSSHSNNLEFRLTRLECREVLLYAIKKAQAKPEKKNSWGSRFLPSVVKGAKAKKSLPGQMSLPWDKQRVTESTEVHEVVEKFIQANCYQPPGK